MEAFEILTSESQERMLAIVAPDRLADVRAVCERWGLASAVIATLVPGGMLTIRHGADVVAQVPASSLADDGPEYERPMAPDDVAETHEDPAFMPFEGDLHEALVAVLSSPNIASKRWVFEQYDSIVQGQTVASAGSDAAVVRVPGSLKGLALSSDGKGRFGHLDPYLGAAHAVAEAARNVAATGAKPLAITNCMNFGNPERPVVMWQFAEAIRGMRDACLAFDTPVTGGNVSFYNESGDSAIWPTPVIGMLGLLEDYRLRVATGFIRAGLSICVLGETFAELGGSEFAEVVLGVISGRPPALDLERERALHDLLHEAAKDDLLASAHDCGDGGLAVTLAEQAVLGGHGFVVSVPGDLPPHVVALLGVRVSRGGGRRAGARGGAGRPRRRARGSVRSGRRDRRTARRVRRAASRRPSRSSAISTRAPSRACSARRRVIQAVTFDFWETLVSEGAGHRRRRRRHHAHAPAPPVVGDPARRGHPGRPMRSTRPSIRTGRSSTRAGGRTCSTAPAEAHAADLRAPGRRPSRRRFARRSSSRRSTRSGARRRSAWRPASRTASAGCRDAGVRIGIICDVGHDGSPTLRERLDMFGVLGYFDHWSFSDEVGCFKPWPAVFEHALAGLGRRRSRAGGARRRQPADRRRRRAGDGHDRRPLHVLRRSLRPIPGPRRITSWTTTRSSRPRSD